MPERFLLALTVLLVACCATACAPAQRAEDIPDRDFDSPEAALEAFTEAWNAGSYSVVLSTFQPERRPMVEAARERVEARMTRWRIADEEVDTLCHPRGGGWKTSTFTRVKLDTGSEEEDAAWLKLDDGSWWMYSL